MKPAPDPPYRQRFPAEVTSPPTAAQPMEIMALEIRQDRQNRGVERR